MNAPLPLIEFLAFMGVVLYLFTMPSSPLRRGSSSDKESDEAGEGASEGTAGQVERKDEPQR